MAQMIGPAKKISRSRSAGVRGPSHCQIGILWPTFRRRLSHLDRCHLNLPQDQPSPPLRRARLWLQEHTVLHSNWVEFHASPGAPVAGAHGLTGLLGPALPDERDEVLVVRRHSLGGSGLARHHLAGDHLDLVRELGVIGEGRAEVREGHEARERGDRRVGRLVRGRRGNVGTGRDLAGADVVEQRVLVVEGRA